MQSEILGTENSTDISVSIVIPFYNAANYLNRSLYCATHQFKNFKYEIVLVNDGSTDNSIEVLVPWISKYDNITLISIENKGVSNARNIGFSMAKGEYVWFMDADDLMFLYALEPIYQIAKDSDLDMVAFGNIKMSSDAAKKFEEAPRHYQNVNVSLEICSGLDYLKFTKGLIWEYACVWQYLFKRSSIYISAVKFNVDFIYSEDLLFMWQILPKLKRVGKYFTNPYIYVNNPSSCLNSTNKSLSQAKINNLYALASLLITNRHVIIGDTDDEINYIYCCLIEDLVFRYLISLLSHGIKLSNTFCILKQLKKEKLYPINRFINYSPYAAKGIKWDIYRKIIGSPTLFVMAMCILNTYRFLFKSQK